MKREKKDKKEKRGTVQMSHQPKHSLPGRGLSLLCAVMMAAGMVFGNLDIPMASASDQVLTCSQDEHIHGDGCYQDQPVCGKEEHTHSGACYAAEKDQILAETQQAAGEMAETLQTLSAVSDFTAPDLVIEKIETEPDSRTGTEASAETDGGSAPEGAAGSDNGSEGDDAAGSNGGSASEGAAGSDNGSEPEDTAGSNGESEREDTAGPDSGSETEDAAKPDDGTETEIIVEPDREGETEAETELSSETGAESESESEKDPIYSFFQNIMGSAGVTTADLVTMVINCAISFWVFFPIFKVIFRQK